MCQTNVALDVIRKDDVSAAIFAPGWVYETKQAPDFETAQNWYCVAINVLPFYELINVSQGSCIILIYLETNQNAYSTKYLGTLPFYTNFDQVKNCNCCPLFTKFHASSTSLCVCCSTFGSMLVLL